MRFFDFLKKKDRELSIELLAPVEDVDYNHEITSLPEEELSSRGLAKNLPISKTKRQKTTILGYEFSSSMRGQSGYLSSPYDLTEIALVEDVESFCRQANWKKIALMYKEGWDFVGKNPLTVEYVKTRLAQIARASRVPTSELIRNVGSSLVRLSNSMLAVKRDARASGGKTRKTPEGRSLDPIAAYFSLPAETIKVKLDEDGDIVKWKQEMPDGRTKEFNVEDIVHFTIRRKDGFVFGTPDLVPVLDDIRALRNLEENIELLLHKHLFPLFQYMVGTPEQPAGVTEDGQDEIETVKGEIQYMPAEGGIVTSERHRISAIGSEGKAIRAEGYLDYFKKRVIAGLGISQIDLGDGATTNRATSKTLSRQLIDTVKDIQDSIEEQFTEKVISELLLESTFSFDVLAAENKVRLQFKEIDLENRITQEEHASDLFKSNGITYTEYRIALGKEPIVIPVDPEDQDPAKYPEWNQTYWKLFGEPEQIIRAVDEPWTPAALAAASSRSLSLTTPLLTKSSSEKEKAAKQETKIPSRPITLKPKSKYTDLMKEVLSIVGQEDLGIPEKEQSIKQSILLWQHDTSTTLSTVAFSEFLNESRGSESNIKLFATARKEITDKCSYLIGRLGSELSNSISKLLLSDGSLLVEKIQTLFESLRYREERAFAAETESARARAQADITQNP